MFAVRVKIVQRTLNWSLGQFKGAKIASLGLFHASSTNIRLSQTPDESKGLDP